MEAFIIKHINKKAVTSPQAIIIYIVLILGIVSSYLMNLNNRTPPDRIILNYLASVLSMVFPVILKPGHKYLKIFIFTIGSIWFVYLLLFYLTGFHNPYW